MNTIDEAMIAILQKRLELSKLSYSDNTYDDVEEVLHDLEDDFNEKYGDQLVSIDTSLGNLGGCPSVNSSKLKPNLSTLKVAYLINQITKKQVYDIDEILDLENLVRTTITGN